MTNPFDGCKELSLMFNNCVKSESLGECVRWFGKEKGRGAGGCFICIICSSGLQKVTSQSSESHVLNQN